LVDQRGYHTRHRLDRHATYIVSTFTASANLQGRLPSDAARPILVVDCTVRG
jgi:hypothetical protein